MRLEKRGLLSQQVWHNENPSLFKGRKYRAQAKHIYSPSLVIRSSEISIIQKFLTNHIAANEIIILMTPYCPTPQHLSEFTKFEDFWWINMFLYT